MKTAHGWFATSIVFTLILTGCSSLSSLPDVSSLANNGLIQAIVNQVGTSVPQAVGGSGALLSLAQSKLPAADFSKLSNAMPGLDQIVEQGKSLGGFSGNLNSLADTNTVMTKLGMNSTQAAQMPQAVAGYAESKAGPDVAGLLRNIWK